MQKLRKKITILLLSAVLIGCGENYERYLSQFGSADSGMKEVRFKLSNGSWPAYCGDAGSEAGFEFINSGGIFSQEEMVHKWRGKTQVSKGVHLYSKIENNVFFVASIPHNRFPVSEIYLMINGKVSKEDSVLYLKGAIGIQEYDEFVKLIGEGVVQSKCFD